jgi:preprotein translocase subunit SecD
LPIEEEIRLSNQQKYFISLVFVLSLVAGSVYLLIKQPPKLGLDLRGGMNVILTAKAKPGSPVTAKSMELAMSVIEQRVNKLGVTEPLVSRQGSKSIMVQMPGIKNPEKVLDVIGKTALLEFKPVKDEVAQLHEEQLNEMIKKKQDPFVALSPDLRLTGDALSSATVGFEQTGSQAKVNLTFTSEGGKKFDKLAAQFYQKRLAILLDNKIQSAPVLQSTHFAGKAEITGKFSAEEAQSLALVLQTGRLPVELVISENQTVGPTLGRDSLNAGVRAGIIGLIIVALYMLGFYRAYGLLSWFTLSIFITLLLGALAAINAVLIASNQAGISLTLPGIAGIVFMFGSAADSSIIVYERIKEEVKAGKSTRTAMSTGYSHGFKTFLDADLVTFLTAAVLFYFGIGPVRGFALTLMIGISCDLLTSYFFTRAALGLLAPLRIFGIAKISGMKEVTP